MRRPTVNRVTAGVAASALLLAAVACTSDDSSKSSSSSNTPNTPNTSTASTMTSTGASTKTASTTGLVLDPAKDYGNPYADGILPVGDARYSTDTPTKGRLFLCRAPQGGGGAESRGPWFVNGDTEYDINLKVAVQGQVPWDARFSMNVADGTRTITTDDLPRDHTTGEFPVQPSDPAYQYDRNPNSIAAQSLTYALSASPKVASAPACVGGEVGVMLTGVALFDAFDAGGRDAGAWEVQDGCDGHPQRTSEYHYHTLSKCITDTSVSTVIGFALDGFPITGPKVGDDNFLTTDDLDECHGITSTVTLDGGQVTIYHYVMTQDFPYSASCFRAPAIRAPGVPG